MLSLKTLRLFLCFNFPVLLHQIVVVCFSCVGFGEAVKASHVTVVPRIRKTNAEVNKEGAFDRLHFKRSENHVVTHKQQKISTFSLLVKTQIIA